MRVLKGIGTTLSVVAGALVGNWVGEQLRAVATGKEGHHLGVLHTHSDGSRVIAINPVITNLVPAVALSVLKKPHWLWALVAGAAASGLLGDQFEEPLIDAIAGMTGGNDLSIGDDYPSIAE